MDLEARNAEGLTSLMVAVQTGHREMVRVLLQAGADVNARISFYGITALTLAKGSNSDPEIVKILIQEGASQDVRDDRARIPVIITELE